jgi:hypothetical protein
MWGRSHTSRHIHRQAISLLGDFLSCTLLLVPRNLLLISVPTLCCANVCARVRRYIAKAGTEDGEAGSGASASVLDKVSVGIICAYDCVTVSLADTTDCGTVLT